MFQVLEGLRYAFPRAMTRRELRYPRVVALRDRVAARPRIAAYLASERRIPFNERESSAATRSSTASGGSTGAEHLLRQVPPPVFLERQRVGGLDALLLLHRLVGQREKRSAVSLDNGDSRMVFGAAIDCARTNRTWELPWSRAIVASTRADGSEARHRRARRSRRRERRGALARRSPHRARRRSAAHSARISLPHSASVTAPGARGQGAAPARALARRRAACCARSADSSSGVSGGLSRAGSAAGRCRGSASCPPVMPTA